MEKFLKNAGASTCEPLYQTARVLMHERTPLTCFYSTGAYTEIVRQPNRVLFAQANIEDIHSRMW
jgi:hypothetical protein